MNAPFRIALRACERDVIQARAFRELEDRVCQARTASIAAEMLFTDVWTGGPQVLSRRRLAVLDLGPRYRVLVLTDDQYEAVDHLVSRARDAADALRDAYYAGFGPGAVPA